MQTDLSSQWAHLVDSHCIEICPKGGHKSNEQTSDGHEVRGNSRTCMKTAARLDGCSRSFRAFNYLLKKLELLRSSDNVLILRSNSTVSSATAADTSLVRTKGVHTFRHGSCTGISSCQIHWTLQSKEQHSVHLMQMSMTP